MTTLVALAVARLSFALGAQAPDFGREVRPVLSTNCFKCHGPDRAQRKGKLRLDVPGHGKEEEIRERIRSPLPDHVMPPPKSGKSLSEQDVSVITRWLDAGATYTEHWAFVPPVRPAVPAVPARAGSENAIDRFVRAELGANGLEASPRADRWTLVRRLYLDLVGYVPTPAEAALFVNAKNAAAYGALVDRLLASPHYGERWARRWLDLARYADSNGYEKDRPRTIWPYRDWVIRALNSDMPFDQFTIEQIAGDMLPNATADQHIATGFHRNTMLNEEGGIDPLEFRYHAVVDRVATTGTVFLGLTVGCAQCHTHKFDPITHSEYFGLFSFLNNSDEPDYRIPDTGIARQHRENLARAEQLIDALRKDRPGGDQALELAVAWWAKTQRGKLGAWRGLVPVRASAPVPGLDIGADGTVFVSEDTTKHDVYSIEIGPSDEPITALRLDALADVRLPVGGPGMTYYEGRKGDFFLTEFRVFAAGERQVVATAADSKNGDCKGAKGAGAAIDGDIQSGWSGWRTPGRDAVAVFRLRNAIPAGQPVRIEMHFGRHYACSLGKFRLSAAAAAGGDPRASRGGALDAVLTREPRLLSTADWSALREAFLLDQNPKVRKQVEKLRRPPAQGTTLVMRERAARHRRVTKRHHRGEYLSGREAVQPGVPAALHPFPKGAPRDRLGLARWLVAPSNPLLARVVVNRHWAAFFGRGIVSSLGDFGMQGSPPTHPALLDWLAVEFMAGGWSIKGLHRRIVMSETYRQSAVVRPSDLERDPSNMWLARAPRPRLEAEVLRDSVLRAAGVLSAKMYGPPVRPVQPAEVTDFAYRDSRWVADKGEGRVRRSLYTFARRTVPFAFFQTFDAPTGEACVARREASNTALQSLTLLNDPAMLDAARGLGRNLVRAAAQQDVGRTLRQAFQCVVTRPPQPKELARLAAFLERELARYRADPKRAALLSGDKPGADPAAHAAWTSLARVLFSLDEAVTRG